MPDTGQPVPQGTALSTALNDYNAHVHPESGLGIYVPRACAVEDWSPQDFSKDGILHEDWLPLAGIVPAGAKAVHFLICINSTAVPEALAIYGNQTTKLWNQFYARTTLIGTSFLVHGVVMIDPDLLVDVYCGVNVDYIAVCVLGWYL